MLLVSIIGDSISTYEGYNPNGYAVFYDSEMQEKNGLQSVYDTWWAKVNQALQAYLCVNNSYSGSRVTGNGFPAASSRERISNLHRGEYIPDIVLIYIGFNDFGNGVKLARKGINRLTGRDPLFFEDAYEKMLSEIKIRYPNAKIICGTLMRPKIEGYENWVLPEAYAGVMYEDYNTAIRKICRKQKCCLADVGALNMRYETLDGTHPTARGHMTMASAWIRCLMEYGMIE